MLLISLMLLAASPADCAAAMAPLQHLNAFPSDPRQLDERNRAAAALAAALREKPRVFASRELRLEGAEQIVTTLDPLVLLEDCGAGRLLVARINGLEAAPHTGAVFFSVGYLARADVAPTPLSCAAMTAWMEASPFGREGSPFTQPAWPRRFVSEESVVLRAGPSPESLAVQKLGFGVALEVASEACEGWPLVRSPHGWGFVGAASLSAGLPGDAALQARQQRAATPLLALRWALIRAQRHPSEENVKTAGQLQKQVRARLTGTGRCEHFSGDCEVLTPGATLRDRPPEKDPRLAEVPTGPWWVLPSRDEPAVVASFRAAWVYSPQECDCCGCESCRTTLRMEFEVLGRPGPQQVIAASRRPGPAWFRSPPKGACATAEAIARASSRWEVPRYAGDPGKPAQPGAGQCVAASVGVWWVQEWQHPELGDQETDTVLRTYRVVGGKVVEVGALEVATSSADGGVLARTAGWPPPWRDLGVK